MAGTDETTSQDGSKKVPAPNTAEPLDAVILEEHIVAPPPRKLTPAPNAAPPSQEPAPTQIPPSLPTTTPLAPKPAAPRVIVPPKPPAPISAPVSPIPEITIMPPRADPEEVEKQNARAAIDTKVSGDISQILAGIKLPERRNPEAKPQAQKQMYDTSLSVNPENQARAEAARQEALQKAQMAAHAITESLPNALQKSKDEVRAMHTLKDDLQDVVRDKKISLVRAVALEEEKRHHVTASEEQQEIRANMSKRSRFRFFFVGLLVVIGMLALGAVFFVMTERSQKRAGSIPIQVLFAEQTVPLPIDNIAPADIRREIANARNSGALTLGAILQIVPVVTSVNEIGESALAPVTFAGFIEAIGAQPPTDLFRAVDSQFFLGLHTVDENAPLIVVPVHSYERAFAAMLAWEKTMNRDLSPMYAPLSMQQIGGEGIVTERAFEDTVMRNYDVRALKDDGGTIQLYYSFPTRNVLIIAESPYSFTEILSRLRADRKL